MVIVMCFFFFLQEEGGIRYYKVTGFQRFALPFWRGRGAWLAGGVTPGAGEPLLLACWVLAPLAFFSLSQSKLPQYLLPVMPAVALAAARAWARAGPAVAWKTYVALAAVLGLLLVSLTVWMPAPISLTS